MNSSQRPDQLPGLKGFLYRHQVLTVKCGICRRGVTLERGVPFCDECLVGMQRAFVDLQQLSEGSGPGLTPEQLPAVLKTGGRWIDGFGIYLCVSYIRWGGMPEKRGTAAREVVPGSVLRATVQFSFQTAMGVGADQPDLARRVIAAHLTDPSQAAVDRMIAGECGRTEAAQAKFSVPAPWEAYALQVWGPDFSQDIPWLDILAPTTQQGMSASGVAGLAWGVQHGDEVPGFTHPTDYREQCRLLLKAWLDLGEIELPVLEPA